jgi:hypothetical protein
MYCPNDDCPDYLNTGLRSEYRDDISSCPFCGTGLVHERPAEKPTTEDGAPVGPQVADDEEMEPVMEAMNLAEVAVIKSALDAAGIPYITIGENRFSAFRGSFVGGSIFNSRARGVIFTVPSRMAEEARILLEEFEEDSAQVDDQG